jgi:competence protein ComGC
MMTLNKKAFMLIEVLVTVVVVSVSIIFINHAFSTSLRAMSLSNSYRQGVIFLEDKIFDIDLNTHLGTLSDLSEEKIFNHEKFFWEQTVSLLERSDLDDIYDLDDFSIMRLTCSLTWPGAESKRGIDLLTYVPENKQ